MPKCSPICFWLFSKEDHQNGMHSELPHLGLHSVVDILIMVWLSVGAVLAALLINHYHSSVATLDAVSQRLHHPSKLVF